MNRLRHQVHPRASWTQDQRRHPACTDGADPVHKPPHLLDLQHDLSERLLRYLHREPQHAPACSFPNYTIPGTARHGPIAAVPALASGCDSILRDRCNEDLSIPNVSPENPASIMAFTVCFTKSSFTAISSFTFCSSRITTLFPGEFSVNPRSATAFPRARRIPSSGTPRSPPAALLHGLQLLRPNNRNDHLHFEWTPEKQLEIVPARHPPAPHDQPHVTLSSEWKSLTLRNGKGSGNLAIAGAPCALHSI